MNATLLAVLCAVCLPMCGYADLPVAWCETLEHADYVVLIDAGPGKEFKWISPRREDYLVGKPDPETFFLNLSKTGRMLVVGQRNSEVMYTIDPEGKVFDEGEDGEIRWGTIAEIVDFVTRRNVQGREGKGRK